MESKEAIRLTQRLHERRVRNIGKQRTPAGVLNYVYCFYCGILLDVILESSPEPETNCCAECQLLVADGILITSPVNNDSSAEL